MLTQVICPACAAEWTEADVSCPACGFQNPPLPEAEELVASWMVDAPIAPELAAAAQDAICLCCGYEGPMIPSPEGDRVFCPACSNLWQDRGRVIRKALCSDCGQILLLTEQHRGKTILCPRCHTLLGCLVNRQAMQAGRRLAIFDIMALTIAFALGYTVSLRLWAEQVPWPMVNGTSVVLLPITWTLVVLRILGPRPARRRLFLAPGMAACLAVSAASLLSLCYGWDQPNARFAGSQSILSIAALQRRAPTAPGGGRGGALAGLDPGPEMEARAELDRPDRAMPGCLLARDRFDDAYPGSLVSVTACCQSRRRRLRKVGAGVAAFLEPRAERPPLHLVLIAIAC